MSTYSLTVSLGTSVGKAVRPWLLQSTVLLLHTHLSGQPEANQEPKEDTITRLLRSPVSRLMVAAPTKNCGISLLFYQRTPRSLCLTRIQCKHATLLIFITLGVGWVWEHRPSPLARLKLPAIPEQSRRTIPAPGREASSTARAPQTQSLHNFHLLVIKSRVTLHQAFWGWKLSCNDYWHLKALWLRL